MLVHDIGGHMLALGWIGMLVLVLTLSTALCLTLEFKVLRPLHLRYGKWWGRLFPSTVLIVLILSGMQYGPI